MGEMEKATPPVQEPDESKELSSEQVEDIEEEVKAAESAVKKILKESENSDEKTKDEDTNGDVPDLPKTERKELKEVKLEGNEEGKCESEDEIPDRSLVVLQVHWLEPRQGQMW